MAQREQADRISHSGAYGVNVRICRDAVRPGRLSIYLFGFLRAGLICLAIRAPRATLVASPGRGARGSRSRSVGAHKRQGGAVPARVGCLGRHRESRDRMSPGRKARRLGPSGSVNSRRRPYRRLMTSLPDPAGWLTWWSELWREMYSRTAPLPSLAPQALSQPILPGWLFANSINVTEENSSSPETEREIVAKYSYGRQLGRIIDVLGELIERWPGGAPDDPSIQRFAELRDDIEKIKTRGIVRAISELAEMKQRNPNEYAQLAPKLRELLEASSDKLH